MKIRFKFRVIHDGKLNGHSKDTKLPSYLSIEWCWDVTSNFLHWPLSKILSWHKQYTYLNRTGNTDRSLFQPQQSVSYIFPVDYRKFQGNFPIVSCETKLSFKQHLYAVCKKGKPEAVSGKSLDVYAQGKK